MGKRYFNVGSFIAFFIGIIFVFNIWEFVYKPGEIGANILVAFIIAILLLYGIIKHIGLFLDEVIIERGSLKKALFTISTKSIVNITRKKIEKIYKKNKILRYKFPEWCSISEYDYFIDLRALLAITKILDLLECYLYVLEKDEDKIQELLRKLNQEENLISKKIFKKRTFRIFESILGAVFFSFIIRFFIVELFQIPSSSMVPTLLIGDHVLATKFTYGIINPFSKENSYIFRWTTPKPGEVVIFKAPSYVANNAGMYWVKRIIAKPGQTVSIKGGLLYIDSKLSSSLRTYKKISYYDYSAYEKEWQNRSAFFNIEPTTDILSHKIYTNKFLEFWPSINETINVAKFPGLECTRDFCKIKDNFVFVMGDNRGNSADSRFWGALPINNIQGKVAYVWISVDGREAWFNFGKFSLPKFRWTRLFSKIE